MTEHTANAVECWPRERGGDDVGLVKRIKKESLTGTCPSTGMTGGVRTTQTSAPEVQQHRKQNKTALVWNGNQYIKEQLEPGDGVRLQTWLLMIFTWVSQANDIRLSKRWVWVPLTDHLQKPPRRFCSAVMQRSPGLHVLNPGRQQ